MVAAVSVIALVAIVIGCFYANYQVAQFFLRRRFQEEIARMNSRGQSEMAQQLEKQLAEQRAMRSKVRGEIQWSIFKQGFIHSVFPCAALAIVVS